MKEYIKLMRPHHYLKNFLILLPLIFSGSLFNISKLTSTIFAVISFCFAASAIYVINDIMDKDKDKLHEKKKNRPIASGKISVKNAIIFFIFLIILSYIFNVLGTKKIFDVSYTLVLIYIFINILYSLGLKNIPLIDIGILVSGFLIRILYGAFIISVEVSNWLYLTILAISFYMGLGKRRNELSKSKETRKVLKFYNKDFLDKNMYMCLSIAIVFYSLWCADSINIAKTNNYLVLTIPIVILLCMKYSMDVESDNFGDPVDVILGDKMLLILSFIYAIFIMLIIYLPI